jgi:hypothetical protein
MTPTPPASTRRPSPPEVEAKGALFQDPLEFGALRASPRHGHTPFIHLLVPFVKTPLRILERTAIDYTPLGLLKDRVRADIMAGGLAGMRRWRGSARHADGLHGLPAGRGPGASSGSTETTRAPPV